MGHSDPVALTQHTFRSRRRHDARTREAHTAASLLELRVSKFLEKAMVEWTASGKQHFEKLLGDSMAAVDKSLRALTDQVNAGEKTANDGFEKSSKDLTDQADRVEESLRALTDQVNAGEKTANDGSRSLPRIWQIRPIVSRNL